MQIQTIGIRFLLLAIAVAQPVGCSSNSDSGNTNIVDRAESRRAMGATEAGNDSAAEASLLFEPPVVEMEFEASTGSTGKFIEVSAEHSGVEFANQWPNEFDIELSNSFISAGIAIGDFDADGRPDFFACRRSDGGRLYRNLGGFKFEDVTEQFKLDLNGLWGTGASFVDIDGDGRLDLSVCGFDSPNRIFINRGDYFEDRAEALGLNFEGPSVAYSFCDYDRDGDLDAYLLTNQSYANTPPDVEVRSDENGRPIVPPEHGESFYFVAHPDGRYIKERAGRFDYLFRNDGSQFVNVTKLAGIDKRPFFGLSSLWWDYNDDGWPDLFVSNDVKGPDHLYRNNGRNRKGEVTFSDVSRIAFPHTPWLSAGSDIADINNDGLMDLIATDTCGTNHYREKVSLGPMSGPDSRTWYLNVPNPPQYMRNALFVNTGTQRFMEAAFLTSMAATDRTWTVRFSDFDQDGKQDVYYTNGMSRDWFNGDHIAKAKMFYDRGGGGERGVRLGYEYWFLTPRFRNSNLAFRNKGQFEFENVSKSWGLDHLGVSTGGATADFDGDGDMDLIINGFNEPLKLYDNQVASGKSIKIYLRGRRSNRRALGAKVSIENVSEDGTIQRQVRYLNSTQGIMSSSENVAHFGLGDLDVVESVTIDWPSGIRQTLSSVTADRTLIVTEPDQDKVSASHVKKLESKSRWFRNMSKTLPAESRHSELFYNDFHDQPLLPSTYTQLGPGMAWGDIDGDGDDDCFMGAAKGRMSRILSNNKGSLVDTRQKCFVADQNSEDMGSLFFDADGDGDLDLYVVSGSGEARSNSDWLQDRLYLNDGKGQFESATDRWLPEIDSSGSCVVGSDFDRDGDIDLFVGGRLVPGSYPSSPRSHLLENTGERFRLMTRDDSSDLQTSGMVTAAVWTDVNNDQWSDLVVAYDWGPVRVFVNNRGTLESVNDGELARHTGWYNSISSGDIDNDGDTDFVVGNFGLNSKYKASPANPELLFYGGFDESGRKQIVEASYENDVCYPHRGFSSFGQAMPIVNEKVSTFHDFAECTLADICGDQALADAERFEVNNLQSLVLINETVGASTAFRVVPLPRIAQISPMFGTVLTDVDGDSFLDLVAAQNFYGTQRQTGYQDGGVSMVFRGLGTGDFEPVWPNQSGLLIALDMTSLTMVDLNRDCRPDFLFSINDKMPQYFESQTVNDTRKISVRGKPANSNAIGARIVVSFTDHRQVYDLYSGGYLSQSPGHLFIGDGKVDKISIHWGDGTNSEFENPGFTDGEFVIRYE